MKFSIRRGYIDRESYVAQYFALAIFTVDIVRTLGNDDLLTAFAAGEFRCDLSDFVWAIVSLLLPGSAISWDQDFNQRVEGEAFASVVDLILNCGCFYIGAWLPWNHFTLPDPGISPWRLIVL
jgi:hypothetical protein